MRFCHMLAQSVYRVHVYILATIIVVPRLAISVGRAGRVVTRYWYYLLHLRHRQFHSSVDCSTNVHVDLDLVQYMSIRRLWTVRFLQNLT